MSKLTLSSGSSPYGAQMGRCNQVPCDYAGEKLRLQRLPFVDGDYDRWGAYWGAPANIWCAWGESATEQVRIFMRADSRERAKHLICHCYPKVRFYR